MNTKRNTKPKSFQVFDAQGNIWPPGFVPSVDFAFTRTAQQKIAGSIAREKMLEEGKGWANGTIYGGLSTEKSKELDRIKKHQLLTYRRKNAG